MLAKLKTQFFTLIKNLGYNITDNGEYKDNFPWLMLRTKGYQLLSSYNTDIAKATLVLDIFSTYSGEKEIIEIVEHINSAIFNLKDENPDILFQYQNTLKILDDKSTGPVRKHGVVVYEFLLGQGYEEAENDTED